MDKQSPGAASTPRAPRFRLLRYFTLATLGLFAAAGVALFTLQHLEEEFFEQVQQERQDFFAKAQAALARESEGAARANLIAVHEAGHVTLTGVVANLLWTTDIAPFVQRAQALDAERCRALGEGAARKDCAVDLGRRIRALPGFGALDVKAHEAMRSTRVFKIKVWDLRGLTIYSSEHAQIGEDGSSNQGWRNAAEGQPASELTHRARFSAFEGVVENRDLISTYVPVRSRPAEAVVGVFELYSDVTPFLDQIKAASRQLADIAAANEAEVRAAARASQQDVNDSSVRFLFTVGGLLVLLYLASWIVVRIGQRIIDRQTQAQEQAALREQQWHGEKMAALAAMAANVSHEVGNPLAVIAGLVQQLPQASLSAGAAHAADRADAAGQPVARLILEQTARIAQMTRQISDFASARGDAKQWVEVNPMLKAVCDFHGFDRRFRAVPVEFRPGEALPACELVPDQLNEAMMSLLRGFAERGARQSPAQPVVVETAVDGGALVIRLSGPGAAAFDGSEAAAEADAQGGHDPVQRLVAFTGGTLSVRSGQLEIRLPPHPDRP